MSELSQLPNVVVHHTKLWNREKSYF